MNPLRLALNLFLAQFHLSDDVVCQMSNGKGLTNCYHDYQDTEHGYPLHFCVLKCKRCGKEFTI